MTESVPSVPAGTNRITLNSLSGDFYHNGGYCKVVLREWEIKIGCQIISVEAAKEIMKQWEHHFGQKKDEVVL